MKSESDGFGGRKGPAYDTVSPGNLEKLKKIGSPKALTDHVKVFDKKYTEKDLESNLKIGTLLILNLLFHMIQRIMRIKIKKLIQQKVESFKF